MSDLVCGTTDVVFRKFTIRETYLESATRTSAAKAAASEGATTKTASAETASATAAATIGEEYRGHTSATAFAIRGSVVVLFVTALFAAPSRTSEVTALCAHCGDTDS